MAGDPFALTFLSLQPALDAVESGTRVKLLKVDHEEATETALSQGRYTLRRPVLLLSRNEVNNFADAFVQFTLSPAGQEIVDEAFVPYLSFIDLLVQGPPWRTGARAHS